MVKRIVNKLQWAKKSVPGSHECLIVHSQIKRYLTELCDNTSSQAAWCELFTSCANATIHPFHDAKTGLRVLIHRLTVVPSTAVVTLPQQACEIHLMAYAAQDDGASWLDLCPPVVSEKMQFHFVLHHWVQGDCPAELFFQAQLELVAIVQPVVPRFGPTLPDLRSCWVPHVLA